MTNSITTSTKPTKQPKIKNKGVSTALTLSSLVSAPTSVASFGIVAAMQKASKLSHNDSVYLSKATQEALKETGLYDKGVRAFKVKSNPLFNSLNIKNPESTMDTLGKLLGLTSGSEKSRAMKAMQDEVKSGKSFKRIVKLFSKFASEEEVLESIVNKQMNQFKSGLNACYLPKANKIITPDKVLQTSVFHEIGHALNNNGGAIMKALQKCRPIAMIAPSVILLLSLFNKRKTTDEKLENTSLKNKVQNTLDGVKKNAPLLTGLAMFPMALEEGIASLRGQKIAKGLVEQGKLSKEIFKKVKLTNLCGFSSYVLAAVSAVAVCKLAINIKDKIQAKYEAKKLAKENLKMQNA